MNEHAAMADRNGDGGKGFLAPTSFAQRRLWFLHQFEPMSSVYNIPAPMCLAGPIEIAVLRRSLNEIVRRHESLRTVFVIDGEPTQAVALSQTLKLEVIDLSSLPKEDREAEAQKLGRIDAQKPFSLTHGPLVRATLLRLEPTSHVLLLTLHHIIADAWSMDILLRELGILYRAFLAGRPSPLPELLIQYADFAQWQRGWLQGRVLERYRNYWKKQLAGSPELLPLPTDRPRPAVQTYHGNVHGFFLDASAYQGIRTLGESEGLTPFMMMLAVFKVLLHRYIGETDIVVGTPIANRTRPEVENLIGLFVNTLVLRTDLSANPTFRELLGRIREVCLGAYAHQDMPFEWLVEELQPNRNLSHSPLFQVMFVLQSAEQGTAQSNAGAGAVSLDITTSTAKFDLTLALREESNSAIASFEYNLDLFDQATIERFARHLQLLLDRALQQPDVSISDLQITDETECRQLLYEWNATAQSRDPGDVFHRLIADQAIRTPELTAVIAEDRRLTYRELMIRSNQLAHYLQKLGVGQNVLVAVCMERSLELMIALIGTLQAGGAYVPLDPEYPPYRLQFMLEDAAPRVLLTQQRFAALFAVNELNTVCVDSMWSDIALQSDQDPMLITHPEQMAYVIYTSGSTGHPKGAMNTHAAIANRLLWMQDTYCLSASDHVLQKTPLSFDVSVWELFWPLMTGATVVFAKPGGHRDPEYLIDLINANEITTLHFVPSMLHAFLEHPRIESCTSLKRVIVSGEALAADLVMQFNAHMKADLHNLYGPTEAAVDVTAWQCPGSGSVSNVPIGKPIANTQIYLLDANLQPVPIGIPGELYIGGDAVGLGYVNRPDLTAERFVPDRFGGGRGRRLYRTGDLARFQPNGNIEFLGRIDYQEKIRGFRVELGEIESALRQHTAISEAAVVTHEYAPGDKRLTAYIVPSRDKSTEFREAELSGTKDHLIVLLRFHLAERLPSYMMPSAFVLLDALPFLPNGKLDRRALPPADQPMIMQTYVAPRDATERQLVYLFSEMLKKEKIGIRDNFFDNGGHSLLAARILVRIQEAFGVLVPLRRFFENPTVEGIARVMAETQSQQGKTALYAVPPLVGRSEAHLDVYELSDDEVDAMLKDLL